MYPKNEYRNSEVHVDNCRAEPKVAGCKERQSAKALITAGYLTLFRFGFYDNTSSYFFKRQHRQQWQREERAQLGMSRSDIQHRQLRLLLQQKSCLCCYCCYYISVVFQNPQAKNSSKNLTWQPAFRLVKLFLLLSTDNIEFTIRCCSCCLCCRKN